MDVMIGNMQALLSGCSAGGLATLIHCDDFQEMLPKEVNVKCLSDAGFFLDEYVFDMTMYFKPLLCSSLRCNLYCLCTVLLPLHSSGKMFLESVPCELFITLYQIFRCAFSSKYEHIWASDKMLYFY